MIDQVLKFLAQELDDFLAGRFPSGDRDDRVRLSSLCLPSGGTPTGVQNKVVLSLLNLERETSAPAMATAMRADGHYQRNAPALHLNLQILATAWFENDYAQGLARLSAVLGFFQGRQHFTPQTAAGLPARVDRLSVDFVPMSMSDLNNLWAMLGAKHMPCAMYRVRMVTIQQDWMLEAAAPVLAATGRLESGT
jgi:hypothetical protein